MGECDWFWLWNGVSCSNGTEFVGDLRNMLNRDIVAKYAHNFCSNFGKAGLKIVSAPK